MPEMHGQPSYDDIVEARELLRDHITETPVQGARWLTDLVGDTVILKCENLQRTGSFKARGAFVRIARLSAEQQKFGVVAASAGNHAQGVALAATTLGIPSTVFMPEGAPIPKEKATRAYGAEVIFEGQYVDQCLEAAIAFAERTGAIMIHPFDHPDVVAGQGTIGLEILEQTPDVKTVVIPLGGGGLLAGAALAIKTKHPDVKVIGVQAETAAAYPVSLREGRPIRLDKMPTMADGIAVGLPGETNFPMIQSYVDEIRTVSEESISGALLALAERAKQVVEPAGAVGVAALMDAPETFEGPVVVVLSGGNIDPLLLGKVIQHGMTLAGRYLPVAVTIPDQPGALATLLSVIGDTGANVMEVVHSRTTPGLRLAEVGVQLQLETRGQTHAERVLAQLRSKGYPATSP
ncbi:threonine ammonia-lyase [Nocardioides albus]|uniref:L-threonine dehydratase catabolic TdcB n=2 Tax=Nocardioides albus TaxID=1841 RepID=A0A7W5F6E9_9ACTN|nr:threonine dehydratase [Nocardioides albus]GGU06526.1 threonine ammonia-lyase [Nocardioides albus]